MKTKIDFIYILLLLRVPYFLIQPLITYNINESFLANYLIILIGPIVYQLVMVTDINHIKIAKLVTSFSVIVIFFQIVYIYIHNMVYSLPSYLFKSSIVIPIGGSNYIASILIILLILAIKFNLKKHIIYIAIGSIILTLSNSGLITTGIILIFIKFHSTNRSHKKSNNIFQRILISLITMIIIIFIINSVSKNDYILSVFSRYERIDSLSIFNSNTDINRISNGRIEIFYETLNQFIKKPIFGWGLGIVTRANKAHNWILQGLINGGITGFFIYFAPLVNLSYLFLKNNHLYYFIIILAALIQGLVEPNFFTANFEIYFWFTMGMGMKYLNNEKEMIRQ